MRKIGPGQRAGVDVLRIKRWPVDLFLPKNLNRIILLKNDGWVVGGWVGAVVDGWVVGGWVGVVVEGGLVVGLVVGGGGLVVGLSHPDGGFK